VTVGPTRGREGRTRRPMTAMRSTSWRPERLLGVPTAGRLAASCPTAKSHRELPVVAFPANDRQHLGSPG